MVTGGNEGNRRLACLRSPKVNLIITVLSILGWDGECSGFALAGARGPLQKDYVQPSDHFINNA